MSKPHTAESRETSILSQSTCQSPMKQETSFRESWLETLLQDQLSSRSVCIPSWPTVKYLSCFLSHCLHVHHLSSISASLFSRLLHRAMLLLTLFPKGWKRLLILVDPMSLEGWIADRDLRLPDSQCQLHSLRCSLTELETTTGTVPKAAGINLQRQRCLK